MPNMNATLDCPARLAELRRLLVMDTPEEPCYDDITRLAADALGTPMALISLVDNSRQWFKSRVGLLVHETPREMAFCAHAVIAHRSLLVEDALQDPRFTTNPLVTGSPGIRFYAGALLVTSKGQALGTLCVLDTRPRLITAEQLRWLEFMAGQVVHLLETRPSPGRLS